MATWTEIRDALKTALLAHVVGQPCVGSVSIGDKSVQWKNYEELAALYEKSFRLEKLDTAPTTTRRVMYGRGVSR